MNTTAIGQQVIELTREVAHFIRANSSDLPAEWIEKKGQNDLVTKIDKESERRIVEKLSAFLPEAGFIAEENTSTKVGETYNWVIDPLDGTTNFIHGLPCFAISIALLQGKKTILGVVHEVNLDECFYAFGGGEAYLNGKRIYVSQKKSLSDSLIATGFPYNDFSKLEAYLQFLAHLLKRTHGVRRLGSAATDLAYVACGRFEAFYEYGLKPWDVAAGAFIVEQAGGRVTDFSLTDNFIFGKELVASNGLLHHEFQKELEKHFG